MFAKLSAAPSAALLALSLSSLAYAVNNDSSSACPSQGGAHFIVARASTEPPGYGFVGVVKDLAIARLPGSNAEPVGYPATLDNYEDSESQGVAAMRALINAFVANCPGFPLVIMGYSQGAQVAGDALIGQDDQGFSDDSSIDQPLPASALAQVAAVIQMGDPSIIANSSYHVGNSTKNGDFPRQNNDLFDSTGLTPKMQSYCDYDDLYCAGGKSVKVHVGYTNEYGSAAEDFIVKQVSSWYGQNSTGGSTPTASVASAVSTGVKTASASACKSASRVSASASRAVPSGTGVQSFSPTPSSGSSAAPAVASSTGSASSLQVGAAAGGVALLFAVFMQ